MNPKIVSILTFYTVKEFMRRRVLYVLLGLFLCFAASLFLWKHFAPETESEFLTDLGVMLTGFFLFTATLVIGTDLIPKDIESKRLLFFSLHPVTRAEYLAGRALGMFLALTLCFAIFQILLGSCFWVRGMPMSLWPGISALAKNLVLASFLLWISPWLERFSAIFLGLAFFFFANSLATLSFLVEEAGKFHLRILLRIISFLVPHLELLGLPPGVDSFADAGWGQAIKAAGYGCAFVMAYLTLAWFSLRKKTV